ncbi:Dps family protein [Aquisalinus flavus]|uniref:DNA starvation/stationary phase protection protein n=1 Tax=Aquisalinus flavus TaxID=1526572 RepID=A0A8J2V3A6_9PROT|nr:DNA starvation/stationary phase protection protein [Aquisalinus flavus]MBD0425730.1 DNA starvation/stationary phase protection protein [Aquisalinus flavus]UNE48661.1 DNA starvation/stationary phase protection protein [Aquisalinus flavus]GGD13725.1 DNA starvation/stationary phase protection protein [Aquisalinus flavus]
MANAAFDARSEELPVDSGIDRDQRKILAKKLGHALASSYVLYHKTHAYHWNVTGPLFYSIHKLTDEQYTNLADAIDEIAERIRALGFLTPVGFEKYSKDSVVEGVSSIPDAAHMVHELASDHHKISAQMRKIAEAAEEAEDVYTADLLTARIGFHEEAAWMLNSLIVENKDGLLHADD